MLWPVAELGLSAELMTGAVLRVDQLPSTEAQTPLTWLAPLAGQRGPSCW